MDPIILVGPLVGGFVTLLLWTQNRSNAKIDKGFDKIELHFGGVNRDMREMFGKIELVDDKISSLRREVHENYVSKDLLGYVLDEQDKRTDKKMSHRGWEIRNVGSLSDGKGNIERLDPSYLYPPKEWHDFIEDVGDDIPRSNKD